MEDYIKDTIAPRISGDGGWVEFVSYKDHELSLIFRGECSKCIVLDKCIDWIAQEVKKDLNEEITIVPVSIKPFFWDK